MRIHHEQTGKRGVSQGGQTRTKTADCNTSPQQATGQRTDHIAQRGNDTDVQAADRNQVTQTVLPQHMPVMRLKVLTITDSQGKATTVYTGGGVPGSPNGVTITATVAAFPAVSDTVNLTVARKELDLSIGTGNDIFSPTTASHAQEWNVFVTDAIGNAVQNKDVQVGIRSVTYYEGFLSVGFETIR